MSPSAADLDETQLIWAGTLSEASMYMLLDSDGRMLPARDLSKRRALFHSFLEDATVLQQSGTY